MSEQKHWWINYPWRMVQTNLREIDMEDINAREYAAQLAEFGATVVTLNAAGILASYETKHPCQPKSRYLHGSSLSELVEECHKQGIRVIARTDFSKVHYDLYEQHPDWAYRTSKGEIINYNGDVQVCPCGEYQQKIRFEILREVLTEIPFDGVFCNMGGFMVVDYDLKYYGPCHCDNCKRLFREQYGLEIPVTDDFKNPDYMKYMAFKSRVTEEQKQKMRQLLKSIGRDLCQNNVDYIRTESNAEIGRPSWVYSASSNCRLTAGHDHIRPSDNASVDFLGFRYRDVSVSPALMALRQWQNLANGGCTSVYIMGRLDNHRDISSFEPTKRAFRFHKEHEELFSHMTSGARVLLLRQGNWQRIDNETAGWLRALTESHVPFDEMNLSELRKPDQLFPYTTLVMGNIRGIRPDTASLLNAFVNAGGSIVASGETRLDCLGITEICERRSRPTNPMFQVSEEEMFLFPHCKQTPYLAVGDDLLLVKAAGTAETHLHLIDEHPYGPPERCYFTPADVKEWPGVIVNRWGAGRTVYCPFKPAGLYMSDGYQNSLNLLIDMLNLAGAGSIAPDLTPMCEVTLSRCEGKTLLQLVNTSGCFSNSYFDPLPIPDPVIELSKEYLDHITGAEALNGGKVSISETAGGWRITLDILKEYEAIVIQ